MSNEYQHSAFVRSEMDRITAEYETLLNPSREQSIQYYGWLELLGEIMTSPDARSWPHEMLGDDIGAVTYTVDEIPCVEVFK